LPAGAGIVLDDAMAGVYGAVILYLLGKYGYT
jgi:phosphatidylglycerophosphatase A